MIRVTLCFVFIILLTAQNSFTEGVRLFDQKNYDASKDIFEEIVDENDENKEAWYYLAQINYHLKDYNESTENFEEFIERKDTRLDQLNFYLDALEKHVKEVSTFSKLSVGKRMVEVFKRVLVFEPENIRINKRLIGFYLNAPGFVGGDEEEGLKMLRFLKTIAPIDAGKILVRFYLDEEEEEKALSAIKDLEEFDMFEAKIMMFRFQLQKENLPEALSTLTTLESLKSEKHYFNLYNQLGYHYLKLELYDEAIQAFLKQVELAPNRANSYDSLGDGYRAIDDIKNALIAYRKAVEIDPTFEASVDNIEELE